MQRTENYRLFKPESTDNGSPEPFNNNADVIDAELNRLSTGLSRVDDALVAAQGVLESGITSAKVSKLDALPTASELEEEIASARGKELTATLTAGSTTLTFTDASITSDTIVDNMLASVQGVTYESIEIEEGALTMTFDEQAVDVSVKVVIR
jgi:hypothetical protein